MTRKYWRGRELLNEPSEEDEFDPLGPDERDQDLMEDSWESVQYEQPKPATSPLVRFAVLAFSLVAVVSILVPMIAAVVR